MAAAVAREAGVSPCMRYWASMVSAWSVCAGPELERKNKWSQAEHVSRTATAVQDRQVVVSSRGCSGMRSEPKTSSPAASVISDSARQTARIIKAPEMADMEPSSLASMETAKAPDLGAPVPSLPAGSSVPEASCCLASSAISFATFSRTLFLHSSSPSPTLICPLPELSLSKPPRSSSEVGSEGSRSPCEALRGRREALCPAQPLKGWLARMATLQRNRLGGKSGISLAATTTGAEALKAAIAADTARCSGLAW
mmetsp:Transcript_8065/g.23108  ORF Transcript_8065/g.23108 Transcript_8065/m.23108 type:complete len:255 (-) Transcript_8065:293-1057(-)